MSSNPFDYVKAISSKEPMPDLSGYQPFIVNKAMSMFSDTILLSNMVNRMAHLDTDMQFDFYLNTVRKQKRFSGKWPKSEQSEIVKILISVFGYSVQKAYAAVDCLTPEQIELITTKIIKGG